MRSSVRLAWREQMRGEREKALAGEIRLLARQKNGLRALEELQSIKDTEKKIKKRAPIFIDLCTDVIGQLKLSDAKNFILLSEAAHFNRMLDALDLSREGKAVSRDNVVKILNKYVEDYPTAVKYLQEPLERQNLFDIHVANPKGLIKRIKQIKPVAKRVAADKTYDSLKLPADFLRVVACMSLLRMYAIGGEKAQPLIKICRSLLQ